MVEALGYPDLRKDDHWDRTGEVATSQSYQDWCSMMVPFLIHVLSEEEWFPFDLVHRHPQPAAHDLVQWWQGHRLIAEPQEAADVLRGLFDAEKSASETASHLPPFASVWTTFFAKSNRNKGSSSPFHCLSIMLISGHALKRGTKCANLLRLPVFFTLKEQYLFIWITTTKRDHTFAVGGGLWQTCHTYSVNTHSTVNIEIL